MPTRFGRCPCGNRSGSGDRRGTARGRVAGPIEVEIELGMIFIRDGKGFGFLMKGHRRKLLIGRAPEGNPFTEIRLNVVKTETGLSIQVEITAKRHFS